jgi:4-hydroxy-4-methyl-2-oxoglutarate aldolase
MMTDTTSPIVFEKADPTVLSSLYKYLRVTDVVDALDGIGYFNIGFMDREVRPLWQGMKFWGEAVTMRAVPSNKPMWKLNTTEDIVNAHQIWFDRYPMARLPEKLAPGHVIVMESGGGPEVGFWGSENAMNAIINGAVGIVTDGYCRVRRSLHVIVVGRSFPAESRSSRLR